MGKAELKKDIKALYGRADGGANLAGLIDGVVGALRAHPDAIADVTYSYRLCATDTGLTRAFSIKGGALTDMDEADEADVTVSGTESSLLAVFRRQLSPMSAMLRGKVKVKGSVAALVRFGEFL